MSAINRPITRRAFLGAAAGAAAVLAGCGSYENAAGSSSGDAASGGAAGGESSGDVTKLNFCLDFSPNTNHTGVYVAQAKGYFADEGLEVQILEPGDTPAEQVIGSGEAQFGQSFQDYIANALSSSNPIPVTAIAAVIQHNTSGIMSLKEAGITRPAELAGHSYGTWNLPVEQAIMKAVVTEDGGNWDQVTLVPNETDDYLAGMQAGMFDAAWSYEGWEVQEAVERGIDVSYWDFKSIDPVFDYYTPVIAGNNDFMAQNPDVTKAFLRAVKRGYEFAAQSPDEAAQVLLDAVPELDEGLTKRSAQFLADKYIDDASSWGVIDGERWSRFYKWLNDEGLVENPLDENAGWTADYREA